MRILIFSVAGIVEHETAAVFMPLINPIVRQRIFMLSSYFDAEFACLVSSYDALDLRHHAAGIMHLRIFLDRFVHHVLTEIYNRSFKQLSHFIKRLAVFRERIDQAGESVFIQFRPHRIQPDSRRFVQGFLHVCDRIRYQRIEGMWI